MEHRGIRNHNPGNIRRNPKITWVGEAPLQHDASFVQFVAPEYGIRAMAHVLHMYQVRTKREDSLRDLITRWAPPSENDTEAYIEDVATLTDLDPNAPLPLDGPWLPKVIAAMIYHENGEQPYGVDLIHRAVAMA